MGASADLSTCRQVCGQPFLPIFILPPIVGMKHMQLQNYAAGQWIAGQRGVTHDRSTIWLDHFFTTRAIRSTVPSVIVTV